MRCASIILFQAANSVLITLSLATLGTQRILNENYEDYVTNLELDTTLEDDPERLSYGSMFEVVALNDLVVRSISFDLAVEATETWVVDIYTKIGSYKGGIEEAYQWKHIALETGKGSESYKSRVDRIQFAPMHMEPRGKQTFFVTLTTPKMIYSVTETEEGQIHKSNADLEILVGVGVAFQPFDLFSPNSYPNLISQRVFNGVIHYSLVATDNPTISPASSYFPTAIPTSTLPPTESTAPSMNPSSSPSLLSRQYGYYSVKKSLLTTFEKDNKAKSYGIMFEVIASKDLILRSISFHAAVDATGKVSAKVFHKPGPYRENSATSAQGRHEDWSIICDITGKGQGEDGATRIPESRFTPLKLLQGSKHSFLVKALRRDIISGVSTGTEGEVQTSNPDMQILVGAGWNSRKLNFQETDDFLARLAPRRLFQGFLYYSIAASRPPTVTPTEKPTTPPTMMSSKVPTSSPTMTLTKVPTISPTMAPLKMPTTYPTMTPTKVPTISPTVAPLKMPTSYPTMTPTKFPVSSSSQISNVTSNVFHSDLPSVSTSTSAPLPEFATTPPSGVNGSTTVPNASTITPTKRPTSVSSTDTFINGVTPTNIQSDLSPPSTKEIFSDGVTPTNTQSDLSSPSATDTFSDGVTPTHPHSNLSSPSTTETVSGGITPTNTQSDLSSPSITGTVGDGVTPTNTQPDLPSPSTTEIFSDGVTPTNTQSSLSSPLTVNPTQTTSSNSAAPPTMPPTIFPTRVSTFSPSTEAVRTYQVNQKLQTTLKGGNGSYGAMFDLVALNELVVRSIECYTEYLDFDSPAEVWTRVGSFKGFEQVEEGWTKVGTEENVIGQVRYLSGTMIHTSLSSAVTVKAGQKQAFYVTLPTNHIRYSNVEKVGVFGLNTDMQILVGVGVGTYPFGEVYENRMFNGVVHYSTLHVAPTRTPTEKSTVLAKESTDLSKKLGTSGLAKAPSASSKVGFSTNAPTVSPKDPMKVVTQQRFDLKGVFPRKVLDSAAIHFFEFTIFRFLVDALKKQDPSISIYSVVVSVDPELLGDEQQPKRALPGSRYANSSDSADESIEMYTTISGQYIRPPFIDFTNAVGESFDDKGDVFLEELKTAEVFKDVKFMNVVEVTFVARKETPRVDDITDDVVEKSKKVFNTKLVVGVTGACVAFAILVAMLAVIYNHKKKSNKSKTYVRLERNGGFPQESSPDVMNQGTFGERVIAEINDSCAQRDLSKKYSSRTSSTRTSSFGRFEVGDSEQISDRRLGKGHPARFSRLRAQQCIGGSEHLVGRPIHHESFARRSDHAESENLTIL